MRRVLGVVLVLALAGWAAWMLVPIARAPDLAASGSAKKAGPVGALAAASATAPAWAPASGSADGPGPATIATAGLRGRVRFGDQPHDGEVARGGVGEAGYAFTALPAGTRCACRAAAGLPRSDRSTWPAPARKSGCGSSGGQPGIETRRGSAAVNRGGERCRPRSAP